MAGVAGVHVSTIRHWLARARSESVGPLTEKPRGRPVGACRKLMLAHEVWLREQIVGYTPQPLILPFALWTRRAFRNVIRTRFGVDVRDRLSGKYLKRCGVNPQRPI